MVGQWTVAKPSRSDEVLDANQQLEITYQIRAQFDSIAPKRPAKPSRSESDTASQPLPDPDAQQNPIPELDKLLFLQSQSSVMFSAEGSNSDQDEFVETQYYKELDSIDKNHYTTGSGFIKVAKEEITERYNMELPRNHISGGLDSGSRSNPATNDWIPSPEDNQAFVSSKPNRSESS